MGGVSACNLSGEQVNGQSQEVSDMEPAVMDTVTWTQTEKEMDAVQAGWIDSIRPLETIVTERRIDDQTITERRNTDIHVYLLPHDPRTNGRFLVTEVVNHTSDTIILIGDEILFCKESDGTWASVRPDNYSRDEMERRGLPAGETCQHVLYFPRKEDPKGVYRLQLTFCCVPRNIYYYIHKDFLIE